MEQKFTVLVTQNNINYINWQMELMYDSFKELYKNDKNVDFISIVVSEKKDLDFKYPYFLCSKDSYENIVEGDHYVIYDRSYSIKEYLDNFKSKEDRLFLFVEADFIFLKKFYKENFSAQVYNYMDHKNNDFAKKVIEFYLKHVNPNFIDFDKYYRPIGWPIFIKESALRSIVNRWIELTVLFRTNSHPDNALNKNWICDMFGLNLALAEAKIVPEIFDALDMPPFGNFKERDPSFYHYCYGIQDEKTNKIIFDKRSYAPWEFIDIPSDTKIYQDSKNLITRINNFAYRKKFGL